MRPGHLIRAIFLSVSILACGGDDGSQNEPADASVDENSDVAPTDAGSDVLLPDAAPDSETDGLLAVCGDGKCDSGESCESCSEDCGPCAKLLSEVSHYEITWTFDKPYPCGQYLTGDWWCVGPLTITSVSPTPTAERNGSMVNPVGSQAYDSRAGNYDGTKGATFPLDMKAGQSLVSSISHPDAPACNQGGSDGWNTYDGSCQRGPIATQAVFSVVDADTGLSKAFRPPYAGVDKPVHRLDDVQFSLLPNFPAPSSAPDGAVILRHIERPWIDHLGSWTMQHGCATLNMYCYGREIGDIVAIVSQFVLLDTPERDDVALRLIQLGIDNQGVLQAGGGWEANGGHFNGRKWPIVFAGLMLDDANMRSPGVDIGNEDRMTYFGTNGKALWGRDCNDCYFSNGCALSGSCTSGAKDCRDPDHLVDGCRDYRNCCTSHTWVGVALAAQLLGARSDWGNDAFFDYVDRWMTGDVPEGGNTSSTFVTEMWSTYRDDVP